MFAKITVLALATLAVASPAFDARWGSGPTKTITVTAQPTGTEAASSCNVNNQQCCNSVQSSDSSDASKVLALLGVVLQGVAVPVGITCSPVSAIGAGSGGTCTADPVCCSNNNFNGLIAIGCTPINLSL